MMVMAKKRHTLTPKAIRKIRKDRGFTLREAAMRVGVTLRAWQAWERGEYEPSASLAILIELLRLEKI